MTINANDKITKAIEEQLDLQEIEKKESLRNERAVELMYTLPFFSSEKALLKKWRREYLQYGIDSYTYSSGLQLLKSYMVLNGEYVINQTIVTDSLESIEPIICIRTKYELKSFQQFLIQESLDNSLFGLPLSNNEDRCIEVTETEVTMEDKCIGKFTRMKKKESDTVYAEEYRPTNMVSAWERDSTIIGCDKVDILYYSDDIPVFAKIYREIEENESFRKESIENTYKNAKVVVNRIRKEVDEIIGEIITKIRNYGKGNKQQDKIQVMHKVADRLTSLERVKFMEQHEEQIKAAMQRLSKEESLAELETNLEAYIEEGGDAPLEEIFVLGNHSMEHISQMIREDFNGEDTFSENSPKVYKKCINEDKNYIGKMIRKDFDED